MAISRETARKRTAWARIGAGVLVAGAAAVASIDMPTPKGEEPGLTEVKPPEPPAPPVAVVDLDTLGLGSTMDAAGTIRVEPEVVAITPTPGPGGEATPPPAPTATGEWKYVGSIVGPRGTHAMVSIDGKQKLLAPGTELNGIRLLSVTTDAVVVEDHGATRSIKLAPRTSTWPNGQTGRLPRPNIAGSPPPPPVSPNPMSDEAERLERERMLMEQEAMRSKQMNQQPPGAPVRPAPLPTDAASGGRPAPVKGLGGAGSRH